MPHRCARAVAGSQSYLPFYWMITIVPNIAHTATAPAHEVPAAAMNVPHCRKLRGGAEPATVEAILSSVIGCLSKFHLPRISCGSSRWPNLIPPGAGTGVGSGGLHFPHWAVRPRLARPSSLYSVRPPAPGRLCTFSPRTPLPAPSPPCRP